MEPGEEVSFTIEKGKKIFCQLQAVGAVDNLGFRTVYFELNGTPRALKVEDTSVSVTKVILLVLLYYFWIDFFFFQNN